MNTRDFLSLILPESGIKYLAESRFFTTDTGEQKHYFKHFPYEDLDEMAAHALGLDDDEKVVYFACAGFDEPAQRISRKTKQPEFNKRGEPKMDQRTQALATHAKALWVDIDCGEQKAADGKGYASKKEAAAAVLSFVKTVSLPRPIIVDSGGGLHCYWPFEKEVAKEWWTQVSRLWRTVINHTGLLSDPARDIDIASVLRPVGTHNRKKGTARKVKAMTEPEVVPAAAISRALVAYCKVHALRPAPQKARRPAPSINDDLDVNSYPPSKARIVVEHCSQIRRVAEFQGDVEEPVWRAMLGVVKHCEDGEHYAHLWSQGHPDYDHNETQEKLDRWETGPTTCAHFKAMHADGCAGCPHKVKSPIQLGIEIPASVTPVVEEVTPSGKVVLHEEIKLPFGYQENGRGGVDALLQDADGVVTPVHFSRVLFQFVQRMRQSDGTYAYQIRIKKLDGKVRFAELPASLASSSKLCEELARHEIFLTNMKSATILMQQYVRDYAAYVAANAAEIKTYETFGWHSNMTEFVLGDRCFHKDGSVTKVILAGNAKIRCTNLGQPAEHQRGWVDGVEFLYNREGMEQMQYALGAGFGSLLTEFQPSEYKGIPIALIGADTGKGKTTVAKVALAAFFNPEGAFINGTDGVTPNARSTIMATMKNLPILIDEITKIDPVALSSLAYATANGCEKLRLNAASQLKETQHWRLVSYLTANDDLYGKLGSTQSNSQAEAVRIFQINVKRFPAVQLDREKVDAAMQTIADSRGAPGEVFIQYLLQNDEKVRSKLRWHRDKIVEVYPLISEPAYRFFRYHAECAMTSLEIMNELGLTNFNLDATYEFLGKQLHDMVNSVVAENTIPPDEAIHALISTLSHKLLVTSNFTDARTGQVEVPVQQPREAPVGRYILGGSHTDPQYKNRVLLDRRAVKQWCIDNRLDMMDMLRFGENTGLIEPLPGSGKIVLGKGTPVATGQATCICINMDKLQQRHSTLSIVPDHLTRKGAKA
jgi:hypothetical protein